jgi:PBP1b-binding outer membrane lipoprotein LpoB
VNIKKLSLAVAGALLVVGCAGNQGIVKNADLKPETDSIRPKPVSTVFHRPAGIMTITFSSDGKFLEITSKGTAPIAGNNAFSIEQAAQVAQMRAKRNIAEFISTQLNTTRSTKVLSTAVQKSLENTTNGMSEEVKIDDKDFDADGNPVIINAYNDGSKDTAPKAVVEGNPNTNSEKVAEIVRENITTSSTALLRGVVISDEKIDQAGRTIVVEVKTGV